MIVEFNIATCLSALMFRVFKQWMLIFSFTLGGSQITAQTSCPTGEHWVSSHFRRAYYRSDGTYVKATQVTGHCRKNPEGFEIWNPRIKNDGPRVWGYKQEKVKNWTAEEIERALEAISELPELLREQAIKGLYRMMRSIFGDNPATNNLGDIVLYDSALETNHNLARVLAHELAHQLFDTLPSDQKDSYRAATGWNKDAIRGKWTCSRAAGQFVQADGRDSPEEDFANNIEYFVFNTSELQKITSGAYQWIEKHFGSRLTLKQRKNK